jgi:hypothetical protein
MRHTIPRALAFLLAVGGAAAAGCGWMIPGDPVHPFWERSGARPSDACETNAAGDCVVCRTDADCQRRYGEKLTCDRWANVCASCSDGMKNGRETGVDCGGPDCSPCPNVEVCPPHKFFAMGENVCCSTACTRKCEACTKKRTGVADGRCAPVPVGEDPFGACVSLGGCGTADRCRCEDGIKDGDETDVDCGGKACRPCSAGMACGLPADCASGRCWDHVCR